ncbi:MAG: glutamate--tRNA ligase [Alphaproteobacteria bacterium]|nr:glutamate--tRNA ligase [Alphaproteobacteria bacterium]
MAVVVRFPPSPTGMLHIGSARTALFNWLFARRHGGKFLLRVEDTDRERSTPEAVKAIYEGMNWLGLSWDGEPVIQTNNLARHAAVARELLEQGKAYYCYCTPQELEAMRAEQKTKGQTVRYDGRWRDRDPKEAPADAKPVVRIKMPLEGETTVTDHVLGTITVQNSQLDDMILLRSDGSPTYMLSVVVDDYDMGITHVIRGDDHMTNTFRQVQIIKAMGWPVPEYAHVPMILGPDGQKFSKRHGAPAVSDYRDRGYLPEAMRNYLLRLCWSHGDDEIITDEQAKTWFDLEHIGKSPARFDFVKLDSLNAHYLRLMPDEALAQTTAPFIEKKIGRMPDANELATLARAMPDLKPRAKTLIDLAEAALCYFSTRPLAFDDKAKKHLNEEGKKHLAALATEMGALPDFTAAAVEELFRVYAEKNAVKLGAIAQPLRAALTGTGTSPPIFGVAEILGREETLARISDAAAA